MLVNSNNQACDKTLKPNTKNEHKTSMNEKFWHKQNNNHWGCVFYLCLYLYLNLDLIIKFLRDNC